MISYLFFTFWVDIFLLLLMYINRLRRLIVDLLYRLDLLDCSHPSRIVYYHHLMVVRFAFHLLLLNLCRLVLYLLAVVD